MKFRTMVIAMASLALALVAAVYAVGQQTPQLPAEGTTTSSSVVWTMVAAVSASVVALLGLVGTIVGAIRRPFANIRADIKAETRRIETEISDVQRGNRSDQQSIGASIDRLGDRIEGKIDKLNDDVTDLRTVVAEIKGTQNQMDRRLSNLESHWESPIAN